MTNRITGTNSGIDVDAVVKQSLSTEQNRIDKAYQEQKVVEYQQEQLKTIVNQAGDFYDKYLDILSSDTLLKSNAYQSLTFSSASSSDNSVSAKGYAGASIDNYNVQVTQTAQKASATIKTTDLENLKDGKVSITIPGQDKPIEVAIEYKDGVLDKENTAKNINSALKSKGVEYTAKLSDFSKGIVIEANKTGVSSSFKVDLTGTDKSDKAFSESYDAKGQNAEGKITNSTGVYVINSESNTLRLDNVEFTFNSANAEKDSSITEIKEDTVLTGGTTLVGKNDVTKLKDTIVNFVNDYNKLMESINEKLWEARDKSYMPLTDSQKESMSDKEVESWEKKASTGLLRNDSDLKRIQSSLKSAMSSMMSDTGLTLESIGIKPIDNYTTKNGMYKIDESTLTKALEENAEGVKDLFSRAQKTDENKVVTDKGGVLTQLQSFLKSEVKSSSSSLSKKIGFDGTSTESNNTYSTKIAKQKKLILELQDKYTTKETKLYNKYSNLEVMLEKLNSQSNSLYSMLGIS